MFLPSIFILLGIIFLLKNLGIITASTWSVVWPLILILIGIYIFWKRYEWGKWRERIWRKLEG